MKKVAALFLLFIFLFNTVGYYLAFKVVQYGVRSDVRSEILSGVQPTELTEISISRSKLSSVEWMENGREMRYNGKMYDIVNSKETTNGITFYCINDTKEQTLFTGLEEHINQHIATHNPLKKDTSKKIVDNVIKLYFSNNYSVPSIRMVSNITYSTANLFYSPALLEVNSPPPEQA